MASDIDYANKLRFNTLMRTYKMMYQVGNNFQLCRIWNEMFVEGKTKKDYPQFKKQFIRIYEKIKERAENIKEGM